MNSFSAVLSKLDALPLNVSWQLESIAEKRGHQELYTRQSPEQLARLREYAMVESAVSSNRIEGVEVDGDRVGTIVFGNGIMKVGMRKRFAGIARRLTCFIRLLKLCRFRWRLFAVFMRCRVRPSGILGSFARRIARLFRPTPTAHRVSVTRPLILSRSFPSLRRRLRRMRTR